MPIENKLMPNNLIINFENICVRIESWIVRTYYELE